MTVPDVMAQGVLRVRGRSFGPGQRLIMATTGRAPGARGDRGLAWDLAPAMDRVHAAAGEGADILDLGGPAGPGTELTVAEEIRRAVPFVAAVRAAYPGLVIGVGAWHHETARELCAAGADLLYDPEERLPGVAAEYGAALVCGDADRAVSRGADPARVLIEAGPGLWPSPEAARRLEELVAAGWPVLVPVPGESLDAGRLAAAAVCAWLGARVFRADRGTQTRRVLDMVSAIRGDRPPARAVRGLA